jgi:hypothetical protein
MIDDDSRLLDRLPLDTSRQAQAVELEGQGKDFQGPWRPPRPRGDGHLGGRPAVLARRFRPCYHVHVVRKRCASTGALYHDKWTPCIDIPGHSDQLDDVDVRASLPGRLSLIGRPFNRDRDDSFHDDPVEDGHYADDLGFCDSDQQQPYPFHLIDHVDLHIDFELVSVINFDSNIIEHEYHGNYDHVDVSQHDHHHYDQHDYYDDYDHHH